MGKISKIEIRVREEILKKENLLKALQFDVETYKDRVLATKSELITLNGLLVTDEETSMEEKFIKGARKLSEKTVIKE